MKHIVKSFFRYGLVLCVLMPAYSMAKGPTVSPDITRAAPRGTRQGSTVTVIVQGRNLADAQVVLFSDPGLQGRVLGVRRLSQKKREEPKPGDTGAAVYEAPPYEVTLEVSVSPGARAGIHTFALVTPLGVTAAAAFAVGELQEIAERATPDTGGKGNWAELPATLVGTLSSPGETDEFEFYARAGRELVFQVVAAEIDSPLEPVLKLVDSEGREVAGTWSSISREVVLDAKIMADGNYTLRISDYQMRGGQGFYYRVNAGELPYIKQVFPLGIAKGKTSEVKIEGVNLEGSETLKVEAPHTANSWDTFPTWVTTSKGKSLNALRLAVGEYRELLEVEKGSDLKSAATVPVPAVINGRIFREGKGGAPDADLFRFKARKGQKIMLEVQAERLGSPLDSLIEVLDAEGKPVPRITLRALLKTSIVFRSHGSLNPNIRLEPVKGLHVGDYMLMDEEVMQLARIPEQPDEDYHFRQFMGRRAALFGTTPIAHALDTPVYKVNPYPPGTSFSANGLPVTHLYWGNDDGGGMMGRDSRLDFVAPEDGTYYVRLRDVQGLEGKDRAYRLILREPRPDFRLMNGRPLRFRGGRALNQQRVNVPRGGTVPFQVAVERLDGFDGPIELTIPDLPSGLSAHPATIEAGQEASVVALSASENAVLPAGGVALFEILGTAEVGGRTVVRRLDPDIKLKVIALMPPPDVKVSLDSRDLSLKPGEEKRIAITIERSEGFEERVPFQIANLPPGVVVVNSGLNGINIGEKENTAEFWLRATPSAQPADQPIWAAGRIESNNPMLLLGPPIRLRVVREMLARDGDTK